MKAERGENAKRLHLSTSHPPPLASPFPRVLSSSTPPHAAVHSLHHRNQDVEPWSGLAMHPVEILFYFACVAPSLIPGLTPFAFLFNGVHLLLSPAASHSGWEDHAGSGQFHYAHHRYFHVSPREGAAHTRVTSPLFPLGGSWKASCLTKHALTHSPASVPRP